MTRTCLISAFSALLILLTACSGGGTSPETTLGSAALSGLVVEVDGQTVDRSGVSVRVVETGDTAVTGADGRFAFPDLPPGIVTLDFDSTGAALAQTTSDDSKSVELEDGDDVEIRLSMEDGKVRDLSMSDDDRARAESELTRTAAATGQEGEVRVEQRSDREKFKLEVENAGPGDAFDIYLTDPADGVRTFVAQIVTGSGDDSDEAELELSTNDGDQLPLGKATVDELAGFEVEVEFEGEVILTGTVPELPTWVPGSGDDPTPVGDSRGRALLTAVETGLEGHVEIERDADDGEQEFEMEAEKLGEGRVVRFQIRNPDTGLFEDIGTLAAGDDGEAELELEDEDPLPLGVTDIDDLVGLDVQVVDDATGDVLLTGTIPALVAD